MSNDIQFPAISSHLSNLPHVPINSLIPLQGNLKELTQREYKKLKKSLLEHEIIVPFFVWHETGKLLDGHQRERVFLNEGWIMDVPVLYISAKDEQDAKKKLLVISSQYGKVTQEGWDEFSFDLPDDWLTESVQFDALPFVFGEWEKEEPEPESKDAEPQTSRADELQKIWQVETGQVWRLPSRTEGQEHRLICGDCTDGAFVEKVMGGEKARMCLTSPPYNSSVGGIKPDYYGQQKRFYNDKDIDKKTEGEWLLFCDAALINFQGIAISEESPVVWNVMYNANMRNGYGLSMFAGSHGLTVKETICWDKKNGFNIATKGILSRNWELVFVLSKADTYFTTQKESEVRYAKWEIHAGGSQIEGIHNAAFPVELGEQGFDWFSLLGDIVYDPFLGSGTTIIAAENLSRQCRAVEISPAYCAVALDRYKRAFNIEPELIGKPDIQVYTGG